MNKGRRVTLITEAARLLESREWGELDLILSQFGAPTSDDWRGEGKFEYCIDMLRNQADDVLVELHSYLVGDEVEPGTPGPWQPGKLKLFISHLSQHASEAGALKRNLAPYGVDAFVAHDDIEPSDEWQDVIESALRTCDAAVAMLQEGFHESSWTDQEIGYCLALRVPVLPLNYDLNPYGFLGKYQAKKCSGLSAVEVRDLVLDWLAKTPSAQAQLADALVTAVEEIPSFDSLRRVFPRLQAVPSLTPDQLQRLDRAARSNINVREGNVDWVPAAQLIRDLAEKHNPTSAPSEAPF